MADQRTNRTVWLCGDRMLRIMRQQGLTNAKLADLAELSAATVSLLLRDQHPANWTTAERLRSALGVASINELRPETKSAPRDGSCVNEWILKKPLSPWITASNQLQFRIWQLEHQHLKKMSRGKCYDLIGMSTADCENSKANLLRHAEVCNRIQSRNVNRNLTTFEEHSGDRWWVVDEWIDGVMLEEWNKQDELGVRDKMFVSLDIAKGLASLHSSDIVCRELSPTSVVIRNDQSAVLTEFELAKLLDGSPTVSTDKWGSDPYRAPEAASDDVDFRADIYSWARLTVELLLGKLPEIGHEGEALKRAKVGLKAENFNLINRCLSISRSRRPSSIDEILNDLGDWRRDEQ